MSYAVKLGLAIFAGLFVIHSAVDLSPVWADDNAVGAAQSVDRSLDILNRRTAEMAETSNTNKAHLAIIRKNVDDVNTRLSRRAFQIKTGVTIGTGIVGTFLFAGSLKFLGSGPATFITSGIIGSSINLMASRYVDLWSRRFDKGSARVKPIIDRPKAILSKIDETLIDVEMLNFSSSPPEIISSLESTAKKLNEIENEIKRTRALVKIEIDRARDEKYENDHSPDEFFLKERLELTFFEAEARLHEARRAVLDKYIELSEEQIADHHLNNSVSLPSQCQQLLELLP